MLAADKDALICDLAETYGIFNYRSVPVRLLATLASGLGADSRIMRKLSGAKADTKTILLALAVDALHTLVWMQTKDGQKGRRRPESIAKKIQSADQPQKDDVVKFKSSDDFMNAWKLKGGGEVNGN